jgi:hypothetical protein
MYSVGDKVKIIDAMAIDWIGKEAVITKVLNYKDTPLGYKLDIGGGHWLHSTLEKI